MLGSLKQIRRLVPCAAVLMLFGILLATVPIQALADEMVPDASNSAAGVSGDFGEDAGPEIIFPGTPVFAKQQQYRKSATMQWKPSDGGAGYMIYRRVMPPDALAQTVGQVVEDTSDPADADFTRVAKITSTGVRHWKDTEVKDGTIYEYRIYSYVTSDSEGNKISATRANTYSSIVVYKAPYIKVKSLVRSVDRKSATVKWGSVGDIGGYQVQVSTNSLFTKKKAYEIDNPEIDSHTIKKLKKKSACYVRIRGYVVYGGQRFYGAWALSPNAKKLKQVKTSIVKKTIKVKQVKKSKKSKKKKVTYKKKRVTLEIRSASKQKVYGFDTLQASCTDGKYIYNFMNNKKIEKCRVVKVRIRDSKVVKVSKTLSVGHGNGATWNPDTKRIVVAHCYVKPMRLSIINPKTLKIEKRVNLKFENAASGASAKKMKAIKKISSLSYDADRKCYIVLLGHSHNILVLDDEFDPVTYIVPSYRLNHMYQDITMVGDYIVVTQSAGNGRAGNYLYVYERDGTYVKRMKVPASYEIESSFVVGSKLYSGFYVGRWGSYYTSKKVTKKVKTKKRKKGKPVYKKKTVTVKKRHVGYVRSGYLYKYSSF